MEVIDMSSQSRMCLILLLLKSMALCVIGCSTNAGNQEGMLNRSTQASTSEQRSSSSNSLTEAPIVSFVEEPTEAPSPFDEGSFVNEQRAWVAGSRLKRTTDGGQTWQQMRPSLEDESAFGKMGYTYVRPYFVTPERGWLKAASGIWQTEDGGTTWRRIFSEGFAPEFADAQHGWVNIFISDSSEQSYLTQDGGLTWRPCGSVRKNDRQLPGRTYFLTPQLGWAITSRTVDRQTVYGVARTLDGGCNWQQLWTSDDNPDERYSDIYFLNQHEGWLAGKANGGLYHTTDGGKSWKDVSLPTENTKVISIYFRNSREGWFIAKRMVLKDAEGVFHTTDGGKTWHQLTADEITSGFGASSGISKIPANWKAGKLLQMLYVKTASNRDQVTRQPH